MVVVGKMEIPAFTTTLEQLPEPHMARVGIGQLAKDGHRTRLDFDGASERCS